MSGSRNISCTCSNLHSSRHTHLHYGGHCGLTTLVPYVASTSYGAAYVLAIAHADAAADGAAVAAPAAPIAREQRLNQALGTWHCLAHTKSHGTNG